MRFLKEEPLVKVNGKYIEKSKVIYFIYGLIDPDDNDIKYVGQTKDIKARIKTHIKESYKLNTSKDKWIYSLLIEGKTPKYKILETNINCDQVLNMEKEYILKYSKTQRVSKQYVSNDSITDEYIINKLKKRALRDILCDLEDGIIKLNYHPAEFCPLYKNIANRYAEFYNLNLINDKHIYTINEFKELYDKCKPPKQKKVFTELELIESFISRLTIKE